MHRPGSQSGSGSTGGGSTSGGTTARGTSHGGGKSISASHPSAALKAYLPTLSAGAAPNLPSVVTEIKPLPQGTYKPTLAYPDQVIPGERVVHKRGTAIASVRDDLVRVLDVSALWKALGAAAVLLLVAGHLRAWLESVDLADR